MKKKIKPKKKKIDFTKIIIGVSVGYCFFLIQQNYILAFMNKADINADVTKTLIVYILAAIITYCLKSTGEKVSRNISRVDENGIPFDIDKGE